MCACRHCTAASGLPHAAVPSPTHLSYLHVITNHETDAMKAVVHTVNIKFRKLKKNDVRNANKAKQLKQEVLELSSVGIHVGVQRRD